MDTWQALYKVGRSIKCNKKYSKIKIYCLAGLKNESAVLSKITCSPASYKKMLMVSKNLKVSYKSPKVKIIS